MRAKCKKKGKKRGKKDFPHQSKGGGGENGIETTNPAGSEENGEKCGNMRVKISLIRMDCCPSRLGCLLSYKSSRQSSLACLASYHNSRTLLAFFPTLHTSHFFLR